MKNRRKPYLPHGNTGKKLPILRDFDDAFAYWEQRRFKKNNYRTLPYAQGRYRIELKEKKDRLYSWSHQEMHIVDKYANSHGWSLFIDKSIVIFYKTKKGEKYFSVAGFDGRNRNTRRGYYPIYRKCGINVKWDPVLRQAFIRQLTGVEDTEPSLGYVADHTTVISHKYEPKDKEQAELIAKLQKQKAFRSELRRIHRSYNMEKEHAKRTLNSVREKLKYDIQRLESDYRTSVRDATMKHNLALAKMADEVNELKSERDALYARVSYLENLGKKADADGEKFSDVLNRL